MPPKEYDEAKKWFRALPIQIQGDISYTEYGIAPSLLSPMMMYKIYMSGKYK